MCRRGEALSQVNPDPVESRVYDVVEERELTAFGVISHLPAPERVRRVEATRGILNKRETTIGKLSLSSELTSNRSVN